MTKHEWPVKEAGHSYVILNNFGTLYPRFLVMQEGIDNE